MSRVVLAVLFAALLCAGAVSNAQSEALDARIDAARKAGRAGDVDAAAAQLRAIVAEHPDNFRAQYNLAMVLVERDPAAADKAFEAAAALRDAQNLTDYTIYNSYGWFLLQQLEFDRARVQFERGMAHFDALEPASKSRLLNNYGVLLLQSDELTAAAQKFERAATEFDNPLARRSLRLVEQLGATTDQWGVVFGGDRTADAAQHEIARAGSAGIDGARIYHRNGSFRSVFVTPERAAAEQARKTARTWRADAYIVDMRKWCPDPTRQEDRYVCR